MRQRRFFVVLAALAVVGTGCATTQVCPSMDCDFATVSVRFVPPPEQVVYSDSATFEARPSLGLSIDESDGEVIYGDWSAETQNPASNPHHVVLWGGPYDGTDMTYATASLVPGQYMFGLLDQEQGGSYQGWINVNNAENNIVNVLEEWRDTVRDQKLWLGFENKMDGKYASRDQQDFKAFQKQLKTIKRLERRIARAIKVEKRDFLRCQNQRAEVLSNAEVLLVPGAADFFRPSTRPTFTEAEINDIRSGNAVTKVVLVADYGRTIEKLHRTNNLRDDLRRYRYVMVEEVNRLERQKRFFTITDHLYHHGTRFVENEQRLQKAHQIIAHLDQRCDDYLKQAHAMAFIAGLFAPDESYDVFDTQQEDLQRERIVLVEQKKQADLRFNNTEEESWKRVTLERNRQNVIASIEKIDDQMEQISEARVALGKFRNFTTVIHRHGPARVLATTLFDGDIPGQLVNAIERESLMTIRLQGSDSLYAPPRTDVTQKQGTTMMKTAWGK